MKKVLKIVGISLLSIIILLFIAVSLFLYKMGPGFDKFEEEPPSLPADLGTNAILIFSKTNGFRHGGAIEASLPVYRKIARENGWSIFVTDNGAVFNPAQLSRFKVVVWNNATGKVLTDEQRTAFRNYLENGGGFVGVHGAGDHSHRWDWYEDEVINARFSHHNIQLELDTATMHLETDTSNLAISAGLPPSLIHQDEWYVFYDNPRENGSTVLYTVDENTFNVSGNIRFLVTDKDFGMGDDHPIVWYHELKRGRVFYSALGHHAGAFDSEAYRQILENGIEWAGRNFD